MKSARKSNLLGLDTLDTKILNTLKKIGPVSPYGLSKQLAFARTTVNYRLNSLVERGYIEKKKISPKRFSLLLSPEGEEVFVQGRTTNSTQAFVDLKDLLGDVRKELGTRPRSRVFFIEPTEVALSLFKKEGLREFEKLQDYIQDNNHIAEGVIGSALTQRMQNKYLETMRGRLFELYEVDDSKLKFNEIVWVINESVYTVDTKGDVFQKIFSKSLSFIIRKYIEQLKTSGSKATFT